MQSRQRHCKEVERNSTDLWIRADNREKARLRQVRSFRASSDETHRRKRAVCFLRSIPYRIARGAAGRRQARGVHSAFLGNSTPFCAVGSSSLPLYQLCYFLQGLEKEDAREKGGMKAANTVMVAVTTDSLKRIRKKNSETSPHFQKNSASRPFSFFSLIFSIKGNDNKWKSSSCLGGGLKHGRNCHRIRCTYFFFLEETKPQGLREKLKNYRCFKEGNQMWVLTVPTPLTLESYGITWENLIISGNIQLINFKGSTFL